MTLTTNNFLAEDIKDFIRAGLDELLLNHLPQSDYYLTCDHLVDKDEFQRMCAKAIRNLYREVDGITE